MPIGNVKKGAFHRYLGKKEGEPITGGDIEKGLKAGGHAAKMAAFAKAAKKWKHKGRGHEGRAGRMYGGKKKSHSATG